MNEYRNKYEIAEQIFCDECGRGSSRADYGSGESGWSDYIIHKDECSKHPGAPIDGINVERAAHRIRHTQYFGRME